MIKFILKLLFVGLFLLLGYYFFLGSPEDKERARAVFSEVGDLFSEIGNFVVAEKEKFDGGDYQDELDRMRALVADIKSKAQGLSSLQQTAEELQALQINQKIDDLQRLAGKEELTEEEIKELNEQLSRLKTETKELQESAGHSGLPKIL